MTPRDFASLTGAEVRLLCHRGTFDQPTAGVARGFVQANLVILRSAWADDFAEFCRRNPQPCPVLEQTAPGQYEPLQSAPGADLRTDLPRYRVYENGVCIAGPTSIEKWWTDDCVSFLIGCSFTFEDALMGAGIPVRHIEEGRNVPMYRTRLQCQPAGTFAGPMVVSMRPMSPAQAARAHEITARFTASHGAPVHVGDPAAIGIVDLNRPDYGDPVTVRPDEVPVFWACGVTPTEAILRAKPDLAVTHEPGHMFITDLRVSPPQH